jgi:hypothetical protein
MKGIKEKKKESEGERYEINNFSVEIERELPQATTNILR